MGPLWGNSSVARVSGSYWDNLVSEWYGGIGTVWAAAEHGLVPAGSACTTVRYVGRSFGYGWDCNLIKGTGILCYL